MTLYLYFNLPEKYKSVSCNTIVFINSIIQIYSDKLNEKWNLTYINTYNK